MIDEETTSKASTLERKFDTAFDQMHQQMHTVNQRRASLEKKGPREIAADMETAT